MKLFWIVTIFSILTIASVLIFGTEDVNVKSSGISEVVINGPAFRIIDFDAGYVCFGTEGAIWCEKVAPVYLDRLK